MSIPSSPIAQKQPKIGTRYIIVSKQGGTMFGWATSWAWTEKEDALRESQHQENADIYALLDPSDAAELERLRKREDEAAKVILQFLSADISPSNAAVTSWRNHFYARIAFEKKIGGGV